ncbi:hypothetical protein J2S49_000244 [Arcanobacterium wilhelmae]|uniref:Universal stress protein family protein n=1 Tax=Arcanobacterium wilhelmae TaxID=1803177 RepID=A0ABT9N8Y8_9ACTO|nr:hypothetical protein [Arcanobacterium wilhelmae]MDP9800168.1 hypothetical protein [Arcanobacterium wilhelmae]WFN89608.1 hypothetical protein P8A24_05210 [Arcanobacterium wilhelmae]
MPIIVPVEPRNTNSPALAKGVVLSHAMNEPITVVMRRPLGEFSQADIDAEIDQLSGVLDSQDVPYKFDARLEETDIVDILLHMAGGPRDVIVVAIATKPQHGRLHLGKQIQQLLLEVPCDVLIVRE